MTVNPHFELLGSSTTGVTLKAKQSVGPAGMGGLTGDFTFNMSSGPPLPRTLPINVDQTIRNLLEKTSLDSFIDNVSTQVKLKQKNEASSKGLGVTGLLQLEMSMGSSYGTTQSAIYASYKAVMTGSITEASPNYSTAFTANAHISVNAFNYKSTTFTFTGDVNLAWKPTSANATTWNASLSGGLSGFDSGIGIVDFLINNVDIVIYSDGGGGNTSEGGAGASPFLRLSFPEKR